MKTNNDILENLRERREDEAPQNINETKELCSGIFWIITEDSKVSYYKLLAFEIPCDTYGNHLGMHRIPLNSKSGGTYNHKRLWEDEIKNNSRHKPYNKKAFDYYPRGRVEVANNRAIIYLNPDINRTNIIDEIKLKFGLSEHNIADVRVIIDNSAHYQCWIDRV